MAAAALAWLARHRAADAAAGAVAAAGLPGAGARRAGRWLLSWRALAGARGCRARRCCACAGAGAAGLRQHRLARRRSVWRRRCRPRWKARTCSSPASSPACRSSGRRARASSFEVEQATLDGQPVQVPARIVAGLVPRLRWRRADRRPDAGAARRPALALHGAAAPAARHAQPARLRPRAVAVRAGHPRQRHGARHGGQRRRASWPTTPATRSSARASRCATRSCCACADARRPACWRRWRWATRRPSSATTGTCSATPAWRT